MDLLPSIQISYSSEITHALNPNKCPEASDLSTVLWLDASSQEKPQLRSIPQKDLGLNLPDFPLHTPFSQPQRYRLAPSQEGMGSDLLTGRDIKGILEGWRWGETWPGSNIIIKLRASRSGPFHPVMNDGTAVIVVTLINDGWRDECGDWS